MNEKIIEIRAKLLFRKDREALESYIADAYRLKNTFETMEEELSLEHLIEDLEEHLEIDIRLSAKKAEELEARKSRVPEELVDEILEKGLYFYCKNTATHSIESIVSSENCKLEIKESCSIREIEREAIRITLLKHNGNRTKAAKDLGLSIRTLRNKINEYRRTNEAFIHRSTIKSKQFLIENSRN